VSIPLVAGGLIRTVSSLMEKRFEILTNGARTPKGRSLLTVK
jgi:hypothetical protein